MSDPTIRPLPVHGHAGADHLRRELLAHHQLNAGRRSQRDRLARRSIPDAPPDHLSPLGEQVAEILGFVWRGIYHMDTAALCQADWTHPRHIEVRLRRGVDLATYDFMELTTLMVLCVDRAIRLGISPEFAGYLRLSFTQRVRAGSMFDSHPTLEALIARVREATDPRPAEPFPVPVCACGHPERPGNHVPFGVCHLHAPQEVTRG